jgi:hypothetical protein
LELPNHCQKLGKLNGRIVMQMFFFFFIIIHLVPKAIIQRKKKAAIHGAKQRSRNAFLFINKSFQNSLRNMSYPEWKETQAKHILYSKWNH